MSTITSDFSLKIENSVLQIGSISVPINKATMCWIDVLNSSIHLRCKSAKDKPKGKSYEAIQTLQLQTLEKVKECITLLLENTKVPFSNPAISWTLKPKKGSVSFNFKDKFSAKQFETFVSCFFIQDEFKCVFRDSVIKKKIQVKCSPKDVENFNLNKIHEILLRIERVAHASPFGTYSMDMNMSRTYARYFVASPEKLLCMLWSESPGALIESAKSIGFDEVDRWCNQRLPEDIFWEKKNWQRFLAQMRGAYYIKFLLPIQLVSELLRKFDKLEKMEWKEAVQEFEKLTPIFETKDEDLKAIIADCFL